MTRALAKVKKETLSDFVWEIRNLERGANLNLHPVGRLFLFSLTCGHQVNLNPLSSRVDSFIPPPVYPRTPPNFRGHLIT